MESSVVEPEVTVPVIARVQVAVVGGGAAGINAALAAARNGADTMLMERDGFLGGDMTAAFVCTVSKTIINHEMDCPRGIMREIIDRSIELGGGVPLPDDPGKMQALMNIEIFKYVTEQMMVEAGVKLLLYAPAVDAIMEGDKIRGVVIETKSGRQAVLADVVVDASGDADIAVKAGAPYEKGRRKDGAMQPPSLPFMVGNVDFDEIQEYMEEHPDQFRADSKITRVLSKDKPDFIRVRGFNDIVDKAFEEGELYVPITGDVPLTLEPPVSNRTVLIKHMTKSYGVDGTNPFDLTRATLELRKQVMDIMKFLKKRVPGFANAHLVATASRLGIRETRRIIGEYMLTEDDLYTNRRFDDRIARNPHYGQADGHLHHDPDDAGRRAYAPGAVTAKWRKSPGRMVLHDIPYRCIVPKKVENLLVVGRCMSVEHVALSYTKNVASCMVTGEAGGTAAALCVKQHVSPRNLNVKELQRALRMQKACGFCEPCEPPPNPYAEL